MDYTSQANRFTARYPFISYVSIQINFWVVANLLLMAVIFFHDRMMHHMLGVSITGSVSTMVFLAIVFGIVYGCIVGSASYYFEKRWFKKLSFGKIILYKAFGSLVLLFMLLWVLRFVIFDLWIVPTLSGSTRAMNEYSWRYAFYMMLTYYFFVTLIVNFINQVNKKYGPGVLLPLLLGRYRQPHEEERIFMFMDLKSSTTIAEQLGHLRYSAFIRDCFADINEVLFPYQAQVYQYVGDEVVVTWPVSDGVKEHLCIRFYFACTSNFQRKAEYYVSTYGILPHFKAGVHTGKVTAVEIGEIKKDIAYHGDTLNTTARLQGVCNTYQKDFLISEILLSKLAPDLRMVTEMMGRITLRGKTEELGIVGVSWIEQ